VEAERATIGEAAAVVEVGGLALGPNGKPLRAAAPLPADPEDEDERGHPPPMPAPAAERCITSLGALVKGLGRTLASGGTTLTRRATLIGGALNAG
jgi:hypothetical protein